MSIVEPSAPSSAPPGAADSDRLRVITAGRVGNMDTGLGTSGFDVVAIADTEEALIAALSADDPDAIVVEADLCDSLEHVRELAPDAVVIAVGDHTPAGALGRIDRGVSGTAMAGLLHALVAEGVGGAAVWGFLPAGGATGPVSVPEYVSASLLSAKVVAAGTHIAHAVNEHTGLIAAAAGAVVASASASLLFTLGAPRIHEDPKPPRAPEQAVEVVTHDATGATTEPTRAPVTGASTWRGDHRATPAASDKSVRNGGLDAPPQKPGKRRDETPPADETPQPGTNRPPQEAPPPVDTTPPPASDATHPPGVAKGWNEQRPPKNDDDGNRTGWSNNSVPDDPPSAGAGLSPEAAADGEVRPNASDGVTALGNHGDASATESSDAIPTATATADVSSTGRVGSRSPLL
jgi:hypothetical protein